PLPVQYADYTLWQREVLGSEEDPDSPLSRQLVYWRQALDGMPDELAVPTDRLRPARPSGAGGTINFEIPARLHADVVALARAHGVSPFMVMQAAVTLLLCRLGAGTDVPIGIPVAGRTDVALEDVVGLFVNTLVLRTDLSGNPTFAELLARVRETDLAAYAHQDVPFERLVEALNPARVPGRHPLFQVRLVFNNIDQGEAAEAVADLPGISAEAAPVTLDAAKFDLLFRFLERHREDGTPAGMAASLEYSADLFDPESVTTLGRRLVRVLSGVVADPGVRLGQVAVLSPVERERLTVEWNGTDRPLDFRSLPELFAARVAVSPGAVAVSSGGVDL
ncbi:condensation domain-containing protein, partial [Micromonospora sp. NPDC048843]|uniref:condensation domain-containing protein n=1 Tax=Micromonospora sp. NPDC048843 TaxID=3155389 RepID=UPI0033EDA48B